MRRAAAAIAAKPVTFRRAVLDHSRGTIPRSTSVKHNSPSEFSGSVVFVLVQCSCAESHPNPNPNSQGDSLGVPVRILRVDTLVYPENSVNPPNPDWGCQIQTGILGRNPPKSRLGFGRNRQIQTGRAGGYRTRTHHYTSVRGKTPLRNPRFCSKQGEGGLPRYGKKKSGALRAPNFRYFQVKYSKTPKDFSVREESVGGKLSRYGKIRWRAQNKGGVVLTPIWPHDANVPGNFPRRADARRN